MTLRHNMRVGLTATAVVLGLLPALASDDIGVARLGETQFSADALLPFIRSLDPALRKQALSDSEVMNRIIGLELARIAVINEAEAKKWQERPEIARQIDRARNDAIFSTYMASIASLPKGYPADAEIASAYERNRDAFMGPRQYRLHQIFVARPAGGGQKAMAAAEERANDLARMARTRIVDFAELARTRSDHKPSAEKGGDLGWAEQSQIVPEIRESVIGMNVGDVSGPIRTTTGWHILRLAGTRPAGPRPLAEVKDQLAVMLRQRKLQENEQAYIARLLEKSPIAVNETQLKKLFESIP